MTKIHYDAKWILLCIALSIGFGYVAYRNCFPQLPKLPPKYEIAVMSALERSGDNRKELVKALAGAKQDQLPAMCDMISRMPNYDLANITSKMLLDHIECVFETNERVPWRLKTDSKLFLDYVLPYRAAYECLENSRRDFTEMYLPKVSNCYWVRDAVTKAITALNITVHKNVLESAFPYDYAALSGLKYNQRKVGNNCRGRSLRAVMVMRAIGIPARIIEQMPNQPEISSHRATQYFDIRKNKWVAWDSESSVNGDVNYGIVLLRHEFCDNHCLTPYMSTDYESKLMYDKLDCIVETNKYPCGKLTVLVKDRGSVVSNARVVVYRGNFRDGIFGRKLITNTAGRVTFRLGCQKTSYPLTLSAGKGNKSVITSFYLKPNENRLLVMDLSKQPKDISIDLKPLSKPNWEIK
ncbi:MAG: transglutaminase domain-containing protein [Armatimonadota bacterium]|nr:hypothetical protein [bacterium]